MAEKPKQRKNFRFKQFTVVQQQSTAAVGTDAVLLAAWTAFEKLDRPQRIMDVGTGTGVIALMLAQKFETAHVDAIEVDMASAQEARYNFENSPWLELLKLIYDDFFSHEFLDNYDLIISNLPYHVEETSSPDPRKALARQTQNFPIVDFFAKSANLMRENARLYVIFPYLHRQWYLQLACDAGLYVQKICWVKGSENTEYKRCLVELCKSPISTCEIESLVIEKSRHLYTQQYIDLTKDFYLNM
ncbi:MAG: methyltransferase [Weeksellaceae bacterium]|nr:methyltransferase [Weeksellaceae bacterium]